MSTIRTYTIEKRGFSCLAHRFLPLLLGAALLTGCSDDPSVLNSVGTQLLRTRVVVRSDTLRPVASGSFRQYTPMNGITNLVGRSGNYTASALLQFSPSLLPQRDTITVLSATLRLRAVSWFGDSSAQFSFAVHQITRSWSQASFQWDSLPGLYSPDPGSIRGTFSGAVARDTQTINVSIDTAMVRRWLQPRTFTDNYGVILVPAAGANVVRGLYPFGLDSASYYPTLRVIARNLAGTVTDTGEYNAGQDTFVGDIDNLNSDPELVYLQSGVVYRGTMRFDVSRIPRGAIINQAELAMEYSPAASRLNRFTTDTAIAAHRLLSATDFAQFDPTGARGISFLGTSTRFVFDIRRQVQEWIRNTGGNYGLLLRCTNGNEFSSFVLFAVYGHAARDSTKRPQLIVKYTVEAGP